MKTNEPTTNPKVPTIRELYPNLTGEQAQEAEENLRRYLRVVLRIYARIHFARDPSDNLDV